MFTKFLYVAIFLLAQNAWAISDYQLNDRPDHAPLAAGHVDSAERYMNTQLKTNGEYDVLKIEMFLERLKKEKLSLTEDTYETVLIEKLEIEIAKFKKAKKSALEEIEDDKKGIVAGYTLYLIPQIEKLLERVKNGAGDSECDAIVDAFVIVYSSYYLPFHKRRVLHRDTNPFAIKNWFTGWKYNRNDKDELQANNLGVDENTSDEVANCLGKKIMKGYALANEEIKQLTECQFDLSKLNPVKSPMWTDISQKEYKAMFKEREEYFPKEGEKVIFSKVKFSSAGSAKMNVYIKRKDNKGKLKKIKYKIKFGQEVHNEVATTMLSAMIGMHTDPVKYVGKVKLYLGDATCDEFIKQYTRRYGGSIKFIENIMIEKCDNNKDYVVLRDALYERKHPEKIRLEVYNPSGWDFPNKREHRGLLTWYNWLNIGDAKPGNHKVNLVKKGDEYLPELMLQDLGHSLKANISFTLREILRGIKYGSDGRVVNAFEKSAIKWNDKRVKFLWADINLESKRFEFTTYSDVKWMARKIARISREDIAEALNISGMNSDAADLYTIKLINRRNELVQAFQLEDEYPIYKIPNLKTYSPNENIKNGKIKKSSYAGSTRYEAPNASFWPMIIGFVGQTFSLTSLQSEFSTQVGETIGLGANMDKDFWSDEKGTGKNIVKTAIGGGLRVTLNRQVGRNSQYIARDGTANAFFVRDTLKIELHIGGEFNEIVASNLPLTIRADLNAYAKEFEIVHFSDDWATGYRKPFKLLNVILNYKNYILNDLASNEVIKVADYYGFSAGIDVEQDFIPLVEANVGAGIEWRKSSPVYFYRDSYGELHTYKAKDSALTYGVHFNLAQIDLKVAALPIIGMSFTKTRFRHQGELYTFKIPGNDYTHVEDISALGQRHHELERQAFLSFLSDGEDSINTMVRRDMRINAEGFHLAKKFNLFFLNTRKGNKGYAKTVVKIKNKKERVFHRSFYSSSNLKGIDLSASFLGAFKLFGAGTISHDFHAFNIEMDEAKPEDTTAVIYIQKYHNKKSRDSLVKEIDYLNRIYSKNEETMFFRNYVLPSVEEIPKYRKITSQMRIFLNGAGVFKNFAKLTDEQIKLAIKPMVKDIKGKKGIEIAQWKYMVRKLKLYKKKINIIKNGDKEASKLMLKIMRVIKPEKYGIVPFKKLFGPENIFVMGEIYGIYSSFSNMQIAERTAGRRFAGKSWGKYVAMPPLRKFLNKNIMAPLSNYVQVGMSTTLLFGEDAPVEPVDVAR